jgi:methyltransferase-like protein/2-polyprenyl-3-methyl-5-hydroxy-6-metoxy-1,4-benzoquinol methylase
MTDPTAQRYDEVPYDSKPRHPTHPDCLATLATLLGMTPSPPSRCRYLELGCSTGGNLMPMAEAMPNSTFVGIDFSRVQIDAGKKVAAALGLDNLRLEARSILDLDESFGTFDYISAHGVYSWVPAEVRDRLLWACKHLLAPNGIAYISYNTLPGWYLRAPAREMMNFHVRGLSESREKAQQARALLEFVSNAAPDQDGLWARLLKEEANLIRPEGDYYVYHEHLEPTNHPVYFHQFMAHAAEYGLQYLGEAGGHTNIAAFPPEVQDVLRRISPDLIHLEQYLDFLKGRTFRRTLLVHDSVVLNRAPGPGVVSGLLVSGLARPMSEHPEVASTKVEEFRNEDGTDVSTNVPISKAALVTLFETWPRAFPFDQLFAMSRARLGESRSAMSEEQARALLARSLVQLYLSSLVALHAHVPDFVGVSDRPRATALTRLAARTGAILTNRRHRQISLPGLDRAVLARLDGEHDRAALIAALTEAVGSGDLVLQQDGQPLTDESAVRTVLEQELEPALERLAQSALLVG